MTVDLVGRRSLKSVIVTGANGFVGRHMARDLAANGHIVIGIGHGSWGRDEWRHWGISEWHSVDVTVDSLLTYGGTPHMIFHCAGSGSVAFSMSHPEQDYQRSVGTTLAVLEFIRIHRPETVLVLPSSAGVYGLAEIQPIATDSPLRPVSPYGLHKKFAEELCLGYGRHFGIRSAVVRLFSIYGTGLRKQLLWDACTKLDAGITEFAGTGRETRDWLHVDDAVALMRIAAGFASEGGVVVNGGTGTAISIAHVVELIAKRLGVAVKPTFTGTMRAGDPTDYRADVAGAVAWGWHPSRNLEAEIATYVDWFRKGAQ